MYLKAICLRAEVPSPHPERHIDEPNECWKFDERPDDADESLAGFQSEDGHCYRYRQLEIVARSCEG